MYSVRFFHSLFSLQHEFKPAITFHCNINLISISVHYQNGNTTSESRVHRITHNAYF